MRHRLLGLCNPLMDMVARVDKLYLTKYSLETNKAILARLEHMKIFAELKGRTDTVMMPGGSGQNSIRVAQWMLQEPSAAAIVGAVGNDWYGGEMSRILQSEGVTPYYQKTVDKATGTCAVLVHDKDRSLVSNPSAARFYHISHLRSVWPMVTSSAMYFFTCFFMRSSVDSLWEVVNHATGEKKPVAINLASTSMIQVFKDTILALFPACDYVFCNESEALALGALLGGQGFDVKAIALQIAQHPKLTSRPRVVVITRGARDMIVATEGRTLSFPVSKIDPSSIVDTNGAGDAFAGGFLAAAIRQKNLEGCMETGAYAASEIIQKVGCALPEHPPKLRI